MASVDRSAVASSRLLALPGHLADMVQMTAPRRLAGARKAARLAVLGWRWRRRSTIRRARAECALRDLVCTRLSDCATRRLRMAAGTWRAAAKLSRFGSDALLMQI